MRACSNKFGCGSLSFTSLYLVFFSLLPPFLLCCLLTQAHPLQLAEKERRMLCRRLLHWAPASSVFAKVLCGYWGRAGKMTSIDLNWFSFWSIWGIIVPEHLIYGSCQWKFAFVKCGKCLWVVWKWHESVFETKAHIVFRLIYTTESWRLSCLLGSEACLTFMTYLF